MIQGFRLRIPARASTRDWPADALGAPAAHQRLQTYTSIYKETISFNGDISFYSKRLRRACP